MRAVIDALPVPARGPFTAALTVDAWRRITWAQLRTAFVLGCAAFLYHVIVWSFGILSRPSLIRPLTATFIHDQLGTFLLMLAVVVADRVTGTPSARRLGYVVAVVASAAVSAPIGSYIALSIVDGSVSPEAFLNSVLYAFCEWVILSGTAVFVYTDRRRAQVARDRMHAAELARAHAARRTIESRLQAMQARVEPRFLFNTLAQVRDLYRKDATHGARMLDELIAYLRAAMPAMRDTSSTVGREAELVRAWLGIAGLRLGAPIGFGLELPDLLTQTRMPAMMLLPLVERAIAHGSRLLRVRASASGGRMQIAIAGPSVGSLAGSEELAAVRERLTALYGADAGVALSSGDETAEVVLTMPADAGAA